MSSILDVYKRQTLDDLTQGKKCVVWSDDENTASKIMLFAE